MYQILVDGSLFCDSRAEKLAVIEPVIELEANKAGEFSFTVPPGHPYYGSIARRTSLVEVYRDDELLFEGVCTEVYVDFYRQKKISCEGSLTFFNDSIQRPAYYQGLTCRQLLETYVNAHNALVEADKRFTVGQVTVTDDYISCYSNYETTMECLSDDLVEDLGGYLRVRKQDGIRYLDYLADSPRTNSQIIRLGENLIDFTTNLDTEELATVIIPLGETLEEEVIEGLDAKLDIKSVNDGKDYVYSEEAVNNFGWIEKVVEWSDVTEAANLKEKGEQYLADTQFENMTIEAQAVDLHLADASVQSFRLLDKIRVVSAPHGLDRYFLLSKQTINLNNPESDTITLGIEEAATMTAKSQSTNADIIKRIDKVPTSTQMQSAIKNATALITGAEGGYVVTTFNADGKPTEIKIQDALENPTKIWRWNVNGLGYSKDGGKTYGLAMTMDGAIVADYITTGKLSTDRLSGQITADDDVTITWSNVTNQPSIPSKTSELTNNSGFINSATATQITKDTVTTTYVNALGITAKNVACENLTGTTISGKTLSAGTVSGGTISGGSIEGATIKVTSGNFIVEDMEALNGNGISINKGYLVTNGGIIDYGDVTIYDGSLKLHGDIVPLRYGKTDIGASMPIASLYYTGECKQVSDRRLKENIADISDNMMTAYYEIRPRQFNMIDTIDTEDGRTRYGFIAQEVQEVLEAHGVSNANIVYDGGQNLYLAYGNFTALNTRAIQDLKKEVDNLKAEVAKLKGESNE